jgi:hypothetical protein
MAMEIVKMTLVGLNKKPLKELLNQGFSMYQTPSFKEGVK